MANSERNFRSHYYEKVGFRGLEEKKSLDNILAEVPIDLEKLQNLCLRFPCPVAYRSQVWRILLGILPVYTNSHDIVWNLRMTQIEDLERALRVTKKISADSLANINNLTIMWLLNSNRLRYDLANQLQERECQNFARICEALQEILQLNQEVFWVGMRLHEFLYRHTSDWQRIEECLVKLVKEDKELLKHLQTTRILTDLVRSPILGCGLAGIFKPFLLARLWDKVMGGSLKVLLYTLATFLTCDRYQPEVMQMSSTSEIMNLLWSMPETDQENVLSHALDFWEMDGCPLLPGASTEVHHNILGASAAPSAAISSSSGPSSLKGPDTDEVNTIQNRLSREINISM